MQSLLQIAAQQWESMLNGPYFISDRCWLNGLLILKTERSPFFYFQLSILRGIIFVVLVLWRTTLILALFAGLPIMQLADPRGMF